MSEAELRAELERTRLRLEHAIGRLAAACEVLCCVARREGLERCPVCLGRWDELLQRFQGET